MTERRIDYQMASDLLADGWTHAEVGRYFDVTPGAISVAVARGSIESVRKAERVIPWTVKPAHKHLDAIQVLRLALRVEAGRPPTNEKLRHRGEALIQRLDERGEVVEYRPNGQPPFVRVPRREGERLLREEVSR